MSDSAGVPALLDAIRHVEGCEAKHVETTHVHEKHEGKTVWEGDVSTFDLVKHPTATRAYAWSEQGSTPTRRRFFVVLHSPPIDSPIAAIRGSILADARKAAKDAGN